MYRCMNFSKKLVIVESPAKCKKIETYLGPGYKVIACFGHFREVVSLNHLNIADGFKPKYTICDKKKALVESIRKAIKTAYEVIIATDDDREGEAIAWHICDLFELSIDDTKRIIFREITEEAIQRAIKQPERIDMNRVFSQQARQSIDLMVGYTVSPLLWKNIANTAALSAGRCQTPTLKLVYDNHLKAIDKKDASIKYTIIGYFTVKSVPFELNQQYDTEPEVLTFLEHTCIFQHKIYSSIEKKIRAPPMPLTTSRILQASPYSTSDTMKICQQLYEEGFITYMRTDSIHYSREFLSSVKEFICKEYNNEQYLGSMTTDDFSDDAHEAIRPTNIHLKQLHPVYGSKERKIYRLIWETSLESLMSPVQYEEQTVFIEAPFDLKYTRKNENILFQGWHIVKNTKIDNTEYNYFLHFKMDSIVPYKKIVSKTIYNNTCQHLSETDLLRLLERHGIGRPSTYSSLIQKIQERKYVVKQTISYENTEDEYSTNYELVDTDIQKKVVKRERNKEHNKLVIQPLGIKVMEYLLVNHSALFDYKYTQSMEDDLDNILKGTTSYADVCGSMYRQLLSLSLEKNNNNTVTPSSILRVINDNMSIRTNKKGQPYIFFKTMKMRKPKFYSLDGLPEDYMTCPINNIAKWVSSLKT